MKKPLFHHNWILAPLALLNSSMCSLELATLWYLRYLNKSAALATFEKKSKKSHNSVLSFKNPAPNRNWKLYDMIKVIHCWVISVLPSKFQINAMAKYLHFEFWFWHSFWFFTIYRSLKPTPTRWYRVNWSAKKMWRCVSVSSIPLVLLQPWDMDRTPDPISF